MEDAWQSRAAWKISLGSATVPETPPLEIVFIPTTFDALLSRITLNVSQ